MILREFFGILGLSFDNYSVAVLKMNNPYKQINISPSQTDILVSRKVTHYRTNITSPFCNSRPQNAVDSSIKYK